MEANLIVIALCWGLVIGLFCAVGAVESVTAPPQQRRRRSALAGLAMFFLLPGAAMAQDVAKPDAKKVADGLNASLAPAGSGEAVPKAAKALPEKVILTDDTDKIRMVQLRLTTIVNDLAKLRESAAKLEEAAKKEQADLNAAISVAVAKFGLKPENLTDYDFRNVEPLDTGPIVLVRKAAPKAEPVAKKD